MMFNSQDRFDNQDLNNNKGMAGEQSSVPDNDGHNQHVNNRSSNYYDTVEYDDEIEEYDDYDDDYDDYDEEYPDDFYERQLDRVLDELADLRKNITSANSRNNTSQVHFAPDFTWPPYPVQSRVVPYSYQVVGGSKIESKGEYMLKQELHNLKEQLGRVRSDIDTARNDSKLFKEISKIKDEISKDKFAEQRFAEQRAKDSQRDLFAEVARINANAELEKVKANAELEKVKVKAELEKIKADVEINRLRTGIENNSKADFEQANKIEFDKLNAQLEYLKDHNAQSVFNSEIARLNAQIVSMQKNGSVDFSARSSSSDVQQFLQAQSSNNVLKDEIRRLYNQIDKMSDRSSSERYLDDEFSKVHKNFDNIAKSESEKEFRNIQAQSKDALLNEMRQIGSKIEALPKNELSPQSGDVYYHPSVGNFNDAKSFEGVIFNDNARNFNSTNSTKKQVYPLNADNKDLYSKTVNFDTLEVGKNILSRLDGIANALEDVLDDEKLSAIHDEVSKILSVLDALTSINDKFVAATDDISTHISNVDSRVASLIQKFDKANGVTDVSVLVDLKEKTFSLQQYLQENVSQSKTNFDKIVSVEDKLSQLLSHSDWAENTNSQLMSDVAFIKNRLQDLQNGQNTGDLQVEISSIKQALGDLSLMRQLLERGVSEQSEFTPTDFATLANDVAIIRTQIEKSALESKIENQSSVVNNDTHITDELSKLSARFDSEFGAVVQKLADLQSFGQSKDEDMQLLLNDVSYIRQQIEANSGDDGVVDAVYDRIIDELATLRQMVSTDKNDAIIAEMLLLKDEIKNARLLDQADIASELEGFKNELRDVKVATSNVIDFSGAPSVQPDFGQLIGNIEALRSQLDEFKQSTHTDVNKASFDDAKLLDEIGKLREEIKLVTVKVQIANGQKDQDNAVDSLLLEELVALRTANTTGEELSNAQLMNAISELSVQISSLVPSGVASGTDSKVLDEVESLRAMIAEATVDNNTHVSNISNDIKEQVVALREELQQVKSNDNVEMALDLLSLHNDIASLRTWGDLNNANLQERLVSIQDSILKNRAEYDDRTDNQSAILDAIDDISRRMGQTQTNEGLDDFKLYLQNLQQQIDLSLQDKLTEIQNNISTTGHQSNEHFDSQVMLEKIEQLNAKIADGQEQDLSDIKQQIQVLQKVLVGDKEQKQSHDEQVLSALTELRLQIGSIRISKTDGGTEYEKVVDDLLIEELVSLRSALNNVGNEESKFKEVLQQELIALRSDLSVILDGNKDNQSSKEALEKLSALSDSFAKDSATDSLLLEELVALRTSLSQAKGNSVSLDDNIIDSITDKVRQEVSTLRDDFNQIIADKNQTNDAVDSVLIEELAALRSTLSKFNPENASATDAFAMSELLVAIKSELGVLATNNSMTSLDSLLRDELASLRAEIGLLQVVDNSGVQSEIAAIKEILIDLNSNSNDEVVQKLSVVHDDLASLHKNIENGSYGANNTQDSSAVADIKKSVVQLRDQVAKVIANSDYIYDFAEQFELLQTELNEVKKVKEEPDYGVLNEVMEVRKEFQDIKTNLG
ncbi:MAG: hypothetical protein LBU60_05820, partial [Clostridiales bacterium]|nr:hypothetical protein [Clostridiales bacterium]